MVGCTTSPAPRHPRPALPLPGSLARRYALPAQVHEDFLVPLTSGTPARIHRGRLRCGRERPEFHLVLPAKTPAPVLLCLPILAGGQDLMWIVADEMAERGYAVVWGRRVQSAMRPEQQPAQLEQLFRRTIVHNRALLAWARRQPWARPDASGILGISTGGIVGACLLAVEPDLDAGVLMLAGGDLPDLLAQSSERRIVRWRDRRASEDGWDETALRRAVRAALVSDPARTSAYVATDRVMMVTASLDSVVPARNSDLLWEALGRPERLRFPVFAHYTAVLGLDWALAEADRFLGVALRRKR